MKHANDLQLKSLCRNITWFLSDHIRNVGLIKTFVELMKCARLFVYCVTCVPRTVVALRGTGAEDRLYENRLPPIALDAMHEDQTGILKLRKPIFPI